MLKDSSQIIKIDARESFVDVREAFGIEKVTFQFRKYDKNAPKGQKTKSAIDCYLDIEDFAYLSCCLKTGGIRKLLAEGKPYTNYGGSVKDGKVISRQLKIEGGNDGKYYLKAQMGPGKKTATGAITPAYTDGKPEKEIVILLNDEQIKKLGIAGERAVRYFDIWSAMGVLDEKCEKLRYKGKEESPSFYPYEDAF